MIEQTIGDIKQILSKRDSINEAEELFLLICDTYNRDYIDYKVTDDNISLKFHVNSSVSYTEPTLMSDEPLSVDDIIKYVKNYGQMGENRCHLMPFKMFSAVITNKKYDNEKFDAELDKTEKDLTWEEFEYMRENYDPVWGWKINTSHPFWAYDKSDRKKIEELEKNCPNNSLAWKQNHSKSCEKTIDMNCFCVQARVLNYDIELLDSNSDKKYKITIECRTFGYDDVYESIKDYYNKCVQNGINIYAIC